MLPRSPGVVAGARGLGPLSRPEAVPNGETDGLPPVGGARGFCAEFRPVEGESKGRSQNSDGFPLASENFRAVAGLPLV